MSSAYPGALDSFATNKTNSTLETDDHPVHHNDLADAINSIEAELGMDPSGVYATVKERLVTITAALSVVTANAQAGNYTLVIGDAGGLIEVTGAGTITIPTNASVAFPVGTVIEISREGAGAVDVAPVSGTVTLHSAGELRNLASQYSGASLRKQGTNSWRLKGDLA
jgi:hypothetical protein